MTTRRKFIQGAVAAAVATALPGGDGVALFSAKHPEVWTYKDLKFTTEYTYETYDFATHGTRLAQALARSMMQTKEIVTRNVLNAAFEEIEIDIPE